MNYLTIDEAARKIGVSNWTISRWLKEGKLSGRVFIASTAVEKAKHAREQKQQRQQPPAPLPTLLDYAGVELAELPTTSTAVKIYTGDTSEQARQAYYNDKIRELEAQLTELKRRFNTPLAGQ